MNFMERLVIILVKYVMDGVGEVYYKIFGSSLYNVTVEKVLKNFSSEELKILNEDKFLMENLSFSLRCFAKTRLSLFGQFSVYNVVVNALRNRVDFEINYKNNKKKIDNVKLEKPVIMITQPRTGSTFLHALLLQDKSWFSQRLWMQMKFNCSPSNPLSEDDKKTMAKYRKEYDMFRALASEEDIKMTHDVHVTDPEDIVYEYASYGLFFVLAGHEGMEEYRDYIFNLDSKEWRRVYKLMKRNFQNYKLNYPDARLLLMMHNIMGDSQAFYDTFPDCRIVTVHRDPIKAMNSMISVTRIYLCINYPYWNYDFEPLKNRTADAIIDGLNKYMKFREELDKKDKDPSNPTAIDLHFEDLVKSPLTTAESLYKKLGMEMTDDGRKAATEYATRQKKHGKVKHKVKATVVNTDHYYKAAKDYINRFNIRVDKS